MRFKYLLVFLAFILIGFSSINHVLAVPPMQEIVIDEGFDIIYPQYDVVKQESPFKLITQIFNRTTGYPLSNTVASCYLSLKNSTGNKVIFSEINKTANSLEYELSINENNFTDIGVHAYKIWCNSTDKGGAVSGVFEVTPSGFILGESFAISSGMMVIFILILFLITLYYGLTLEWKNEVVPQDNYVYIDYKKYLKLVLLFISYLILTFLFAIAKGITSAITYSTEAYHFFDLALNFALIGIVPTFILTFVFIVIGALSDKKIHDAVTRGLPIR